VRDREATSTRSTVRTAVVAAAATAVVTLAAGYYAPGFFEAISGEDAVVISAGPNTEEPGWLMVFRDEVDPETAPPPGSSCSDARAWGNEHRGVSVGETELAVHLQGRRRGEVLITTMRARVLERGQPLRTALFEGCRGAGGRPTIGIGFDLDSPDPRARSMENDELGQELFFEDNQVALGDGEAVAFNVTGRTKDSYVRWVIDVVIQVDGSEETLTIGDEAFETSAYVQTGYDEWWSWGAPAGASGPCCRLTRVE